jgi:hypothetical protein
MTGDTQQLLDRIAACENRSKANPRKVVKVSPGFYYLTVDDLTWSITHEREIDRWVAYVNNFVYTDEMKTKREIIESILG